MHLYLDTTNSLVVGVLNSDLEFVVYRKIETKKISQTLQAEIYSALGEVNLSIREIESLFYCAGPGSYTGMRVAQGFVDICAWKEIKVYSYYSFQVPKILGTKSGHWVSEAFKGEYFLHEWDEQQGRSKLIKKDDLDLNGFENELFVGEAGEQTATVVSELIEKNPSKLFRHLLENDWKVPLYYYRPLEEEFKVPNG